MVRTFEATVIREYEPDMERMVKALRVLLECEPKGEEQVGNNERFEDDVGETWDNESGRSGIISGPPGFWQGCQADSVQGPCKIIKTGSSSAA